MQKEIRKEMILRRKNFLPSLVIIIVLFTTLVSILYFTDPSSQLFLILFFTNLFAFLIFFLSLIFGNSRRGLILSICITIFTILRMLGVGNILNAILLASLGIIAEIYASTTKRNKKHILSNP